MKAINRTNVQVEVKGQALDIASRTTLGVIGGTSLLVGAWAVACLIGAMVSAGPFGLIKGNNPSKTNISASALNKSSHIRLPTYRLIAHQALQII